MVHSRVHAEAYAMTPNAKKLLIVLGVVSLIGIIVAVVTRDTDAPPGRRGVAGNR